MEVRNHIYKFDVDNKITGLYIKKLRKAKGWTAEKLAEKLVCSPKTISSWETGVRQPSLDMLVEMSNLFDVTVHSLLLPMDNCPFDNIGTFPDMIIGLFPSEIDFCEGQDEDTEKIYVRTEYLLQRLIGGVFTKKDRDELLHIGQFNVVAFSDGDINEIKKEILSEKSYEKILLKWFRQIMKSAKRELELIRRHFKLDSNNILEHNKIVISPLHIFFIRLYCSNNIPKAIKAMDIIEKSILLTATLLCKNIRNSDFARGLFNSGAFLIRDALVDVPADILEAINDEVSVDAINIAKYVTDEYTDFNGLQDELCGYLQIIDYISYLVYKRNPSSLEDFLCIENNISFDEYVDNLKKGGQINE